MQTGSFLDNRISKDIKYAYLHRGLNTPYQPNLIEEAESHDYYTKENGNLFFGEIVGWRDDKLIQGGVDIKVELSEKCFVDHVSLVQAKGSALADVEILTVTDGVYNKIGTYGSETGKLIEDEKLTIPVGYLCDNVVVRLNADCMPIKIKKLDIFGAWDLENTIFPSPFQAQYLDSTFSLKDLKVIKASGEDELFAAAYLCEKLEARTGHTLEISENAGDIVLCIEENGNAADEKIQAEATGAFGPKETFMVDVADGKCTLKAPNRLCLIYAVDALLQLVDGEQVKCCHIEDVAFMEFRGAHMALPARKDIAFLKNMIKYVFVPMRYNTIYLQISGAMEYENYPEINRAWQECNEKYESGEWPMPAHYGFIGKDILTKAEVRELCEYMTSFGLEVIPEVQSWGHTQYITTAYPELGEKIAVEVAEDDGLDLNVEDIAPDTFYQHNMCPMHERYYDVIFGILDEVLEVVQPKRFVHMGHDEIYRVGSCSKCSKIPRGDIFATEVTRLNEYIKQKNLTMMIWSDMLQQQKYATPFAINKVPKDIVMLDFVWYFHVDEDIEDNLLSHGFKVIMGNMYSSHYPRFEARSRKQGMMGAEVSTWIPCDELSYAFYGKMYDFVYSAEMMWSSSYDNEMRLTYNELVKPILADIRYKIGNFKKTDGSENGKEMHVSIGGMRQNVPFDIRDIVAYESAVSTDAKAPVNEIAIDAYADILTVVHATDKSSHRIMWEDPVKIGEYVIVYEDGSEVVEDILYAGNIHKYRSTYGDRITSSFFRHQGYVGTYLAIPECGKTYNGEDYTLGKYSIKNPHPEKKVKAIRINHMGNTDAAILLFDLIVK